MKGMKRCTLYNLVLTIAFLLASCSSEPLRASKETSLSSLSTHVDQALASPSPVYHTMQSKTDDTLKRWNHLHLLPQSKLTLMRQEAHDGEERAWAELALISKEKYLNTPELAAKLLAWQEQFRAHPGNQLLPDHLILTQLEAYEPPKKIAVLLPESGKFKLSGRMLRAGFLNAYYAHLSQGANEEIRFYDTMLTQNIAELYQQAINDGAEVIVGPLLKENVQQLSQSSFPLRPTLALNYSDLTHGLPNNLYEFGLLPEDEAAQMAEHARAKGLLHALLIAKDDTWGKRLASAFSTIWQAQGGTIEDTWYYGARQTFPSEIAHLLHVNTYPPKAFSKDLAQTEAPNRRQDFDVIFLFAQQNEARGIVPLLRYDYSGKAPIYALSSLYAKASDLNEVDLEGVTICDMPEGIRTQKGVTHTPIDRLFAVGYDAYILSHSFVRLAYLPHFPIYGTTGALLLSAQHQFHRLLTCKTIHREYFL